ncbi:DUF2971 domain-containing protein [Halomonas meridiana]|nr:DUF2971 domain-containing protein [Halomonas meridiana]MDP4557974.1 DUF2971 domain-containing protein [Halomonas meridiana]
MMILYKFYRFGWCDYVDLKKGVVGKKSHLINSLSDGYIYCSTFHHLNDAFELKGTPNMEVSSDKLEREIQKEKLADFVMELAGHRCHLGLDDSGYPSRDFFKNLSYDQLCFQVEFARNVINNIYYKYSLEKRVACFTESFDHELMWGHYADGMKGICVKYKFDNERKNSFERVNYLRHVENLDLWKFIDGLEDSFSRLHLFKSCTWSYEDEVRLIADDERYYYHAHELEEIYIGSKCPLDDAVQLMDALQSNGVDCSFRLAFPDSCEYKIKLSGRMSSVQILEALAERDDGSLNMFGINIYK